MEVFQRKVYNEFIQLNYHYIINTEGNENVTALIIELFVHFLHFKTV